MNVYLRHLKSAMEKVLGDYYSTHAFRYSGLNDIELDASEMATYEQQVERVYCYELYHQFKLLISLPENAKHYQDLTLNGEVTKIDFNQTTINCKSIIPDLILHKSQTDIRHNYQTLFIEVKTNPNPSIVNDLRKIILAVEALNFQFGVLIAINSNFAAIEEKVRCFFDCLDTEVVAKKIFVFHSDTPGTINVKSLDKIVSPN